MRTPGLLARFNVPEADISGQREAVPAIGAKADGIASFDLKRAHERQLCGELLLYYGWLVY
jgi:hypothetical protein